MLHIYTCGFFPGFYESTLYNSDSELYANEALSENRESYELKDFNGFMNAVGRCIDVILDFYFESVIDMESYQLDITEAADSLLFEYMEPTEDSNNEK